MIKDTMKKEKKKWQVKTIYLQGQRQKEHLQMIKRRRKMPRNMPTWGKKLKEIVK